MLDTIGDVNFVIGCSDGW